MGSPARSLGKWNEASLSSKALPGSLWLSVGECQPRRLRFATQLSGLEGICQPPGTRVSHLQDGVVGQESPLNSIPGKTPLTF